MHIKHEKRIPPIIPKDPIDDLKTYTVRKKKKYTLSFRSLPNGTAKNLLLIFFQYRPSEFAFCHYKLKNVKKSSKSLTLKHPSIDKSIHEYIRHIQDIQ